MPVSVDLDIKWIIVPLLIISKYKLIHVNIMGRLGTITCKQGVAFSGEFYDHKIGTKMESVSICVPVCINWHQGSTFTLVISPISSPKWTLTTWILTIVIQMNIYDDDNWSCFG